MKTNKAMLRVRGDVADVCKIEPVAIGLAEQYAGLLIQFREADARRTALLQKVVVIELQRAAIKKALELAGTLIAISRPVI